ncbi:MAG: hypothetical protein WAM14_11925 [Candidatus Nitrosopolaris sp.]
MDNKLRMSSDLSHYPYLPNEFLMSGFSIFLSLTAGVYPAWKAVVVVE